MSKKLRLEALENRLYLTVAVEVVRGDLVIEGVEGEAAGEVVITGHEGGLFQVAVDGEVVAQDLEVTESASVAGDRLDSGGRLSHRLYSAILEPQGSSLPRAVPLENLAYPHACC